MGMDHSRYVIFVMDVSDTLSDTLFRYTIHFQIHYTLPDTLFRYTIQFQIHYTLSDKRYTFR